MIYRIKNVVLLTDVFILYVITLRDGKLKKKWSCLHCVCVQLFS